MYLDIYRFFSPMRKNRVIVQLLTFIISAIIHEFIIFYAIGFFYPILFILFTGPGTFFCTQESPSCSYRLFADVQSTWYFGSRCTSALLWCLPYTWLKSLPVRRYLTRRWTRCGVVWVGSFLVLYTWVRCFDRYYRLWIRSLNINLYCPMNSILL